MIHISMSGKEPPEEWCRKAESLTEKLKRLTPEERKKLIEKNNIWGELKEWLLQLSHGKCWYSEAKEIYSFYDVDHFRPKNRAKQLDGTERDGYWWLAFDWRNYRISGAIGNRPNRGEDNEIRGKADYFPLREGSPVATGPECDLRDELIYFLDPTDANDPLLLTFDELGSPQPAVSEGEDKWTYERVTTTIKYLHLDYRPLVDERKKIGNTCSRLIDKAQNLMKEQGESPSVTRKTEIDNIFNELRERISVEAELSSTARACLLSRGITGNIQWVMNLVSRP